MPVAQPFYTSGAGNGLPTCLPKIDVTDRGDGQPYDYWTTLSGVNKGSPITSDALIAESLVLAYRLYWFGFSVSVSSSAMGFDVSDFSSVSLADVSGQPSSEPKDRLCITDLLGDVVQDSGENTQVRANINIRLPAMIYNGVTTDEANFMGYAGYVRYPDASFDDYGSHSLAWTDSFGAGGSVSVQIQSAIGKAEVAIGGRDIDFAYVTVNGMHLVCKAFANDGGVQTVNASTLSASATSTIGAGEEETATDSAQINSLGFYT